MGGLLTAGGGLGAGCGAVDSSGVGGLLSACGGLLAGDGGAAVQALVATARHAQAQAASRGERLALVPRNLIRNLMLIELGADHEPLSVVPDRRQPHTRARDERHGGRLTWLN